MDKGRKSVFRSFALITQLGLHIMVPIALCVAVGVLIDNKFGTFWVIPLLIIGMLAGGRNAYKLAMSAAKSDSKAAGNGSGLAQGGSSDEIGSLPDEDDDDDDWQ